MQQKALNLLSPRASSSCARTEMCSLLRLPVEGGTVQPHTGRKHPTTKPKAPHTKLQKLTALFCLSPHPGQSPVSPPSPPPALLSPEEPRQVYPHITLTHPFQMLRLGLFPPLACFPRGERLCNRMTATPTLETREAGGEALSTVLLPQSPPSPGWPAPPRRTWPGWCDSGISWRASDVAFAADRNRDPSEIMAEPSTPSPRGNGELPRDKVTSL